MHSKPFKYLATGIAPWCYPTDTFFALLYYNSSDAVEVPKRLPYMGEWGEAISNHLLENDTQPMPTRLDMVWLSITEFVFYSICTDLDSSLLEKKWTSLEGENEFSHIVVGMAPYGKVALWFRGTNKSILIDWLQGETVEVEMKEFCVMNPTVKLKEYCNHYINNNNQVKENLIKNGLPPRNLFDKYMQQFTYRYLPIYEKWDKDEEKWCKYEEDDEKIPDFEYIEESLYDGTHDKLHDGGLLKYHEAGKPKKLAIKWHIKKSEYTAYFWFEETLICEIFDKFYGAHRDTKVDFIIRIDAEQKKYELSLYRYGLKEPLIIPEAAYQLLVFKSKFEHYRSENYNQERGAWIW